MSDWTRKERKDFDNDIQSRLKEHGFARVTRQRHEGKGALRPWQELKVREALPDPGVNARRKR